MSNGHSSLHEIANHKSDISFIRAFFNVSGCSKMTRLFASETNSFILTCYLISNHYTT